MPRLRRLRHPQAGPDRACRAPDSARAGGLPLRHWLLLALPLLHEHVRIARHPRAGTGVCLRAQAHPPRTPRLDHHRRWRWTLHRHKPPVASAAAQPGCHRRALQQPGLRADQRAALSDLSPRAGDPILAVGFGGVPLQPRVAGVERRSNLCGAYVGPGPCPSAHGARARCPAPGRRLCGGLPELPGLQRRCLRPLYGEGVQALERALCGARQAAPLRSQWRACRAAPHDHSRGGLHRGGGAFGAMDSR